METRDYIAKPTNYYANIIANRQQWENARKRCKKKKEKRDNKKEANKKELYLPTYAFKVMYKSLVWYISTLIL